VNMTHNQGQQFLGNHMKKVESAVRNIINGGPISNRDALVTQTPSTILKRFDPNFKNRVKKKGF